MPIDTVIEQLLNQYALMWRSLVTSSDLSTKKELVLAMEDLREQADLDDTAWEEFTTTLPGYDEWWYRMRESYLAYLAEALEQVEE